MNHLELRFPAMSYQRKPILQQATRVTAAPDRRLSAGFKGLVDDPELSQLFDLIHGLSEYTFERHMWEVSEDLERVLDSILNFKDRRDRGVTGFYSRRKSALPLGTSEKIRQALKEEMTHQVIAVVEDKTA